MSRNEMLQCPYDPNHKVCGARFQYHVVKCKAKHPELDGQERICPYNARHRLSFENYPRHLLNCPDRIILFRDNVRGRPVAEVVNRPNNCGIGNFKNPNVSATEEDFGDWGLNEDQATINNDVEQEESFMNSSVASSCSKESVKTVVTARYIPGIGRCRRNINNDDDDKLKSFGRAAFRHC